MPSTFVRSFSSAFAISSIVLNFAFFKAFSALGPTPGKVDTGSAAS